MRYALVVAGSPRDLAAVRHGSLVVVRPSSTAYYQGAPAPELVPTTSRESPEGTFLGVALRPPILAGMNSGVDLAVISLVVSGCAEIHDDAKALLMKDIKTAAWAAWRKRDVLLLKSENQIVLR